jgi:trk system potassium uptake protein TrkA
VKVVIVGAGEVGFNIASRIAHENKDVVVIDKNPEAIRRISEALDVQTVVGSGSSPSALEEAGIREADIVLAVTDQDDTNLVACLISNMISPTTKKLARMRTADYDPFHEYFRDHPPHIDTIINPDVEVVKSIERMIDFPGVVDIAEFAEGRVKFIGVSLEKGARLAGVALMDLSKHFRHHRPLIAAVIRNEELIIPRGDDRLMENDLVYFITDNDKIFDTLAVFGKSEPPLTRALIVGGGSIGLRLASRLEQKNIYTKIVEKNPDRCRYLAEKLNKVVVLHGDGSDQSLLTEENVDDIDVVITLTNDEETNILSSLLAKRLGARKTITRISKFSYFPLMSMIGIELVVSPRLSAINTILQHIRKGKVLSAASIKGEQGEILEAVALETSDIVGKPLRQIAFPKGSLLTGIIRNEQIIIPSGDSVVEPGDRIIIFARRQAITKVEKILTVKLEYF